MSDDDDDDTAASYNTADDFTLQPNDVVFSRAASLYRKHPGNMAYWDLVDECCFKMGRLQDRTAQQYKEMIDKLYKFVIHKNKGRFINHNGMMQFDVLQRKEANKKIKGSLVRYRKYYFMDSPAAFSNRRKSGAAASDENEDESTSDDHGTTTAARKSSSAPRRHRNPTMDERNEVIPFAPQKHDVIYGINDKATMKHPGNVHYRSLLSNYFPRLEKATDPTAQQYRDMASNILHVIVHQRKGRFLRPTDSKGRFQRKIVDGSKRYCVVMTPNLREYKVRCALYKHRSLFRDKKLPPTKKRKNAVDSDSASSSDKDSGDEDDDDKDNDDHDSLPPQPRKTRRMCGRSLTPVAVADNDEEDDDNDEEDDKDNDNNDDDSLPPPAKTTTRRMCGRSLAPVVVVDNNDDDDEEEDDDGEKDYMENDDDDEEEEGHDEPPNTNDPTNNHQFQYGSQQALLEMRNWLNQHRLPQSVGDTLESHGVRDIHDVRLLMQLQSHVLEAELLALDFYKLRSAVESMDGNGN